MGLERWEWREVDGRQDLRFQRCRATVARPDHGQMLLDSLVPLWDLTSKRAAL